MRQSSTWSYGFHSTGRSILYLQRISKLTSQCEIRTLWPELTTNNRVLSFDMSTGCIDRRKHTKTPPHVNHSSKQTIGFQGVTSSEEGKPILLDHDPAKYWQNICIVPLGSYFRVFFYKSARYIYLNASENSLPCQADRVSLCSLIFCATESSMQN